MRFECWPRNFENFDFGRWGVLKAAQDILSGGGLDVPYLWMQFYWGKLRFRLSPVGVGSCLLYWLALNWYLTSVVCKSNVLYFLNRRLLKLNRRLTIQDILLVAGCTWLINGSLQMVRALKHTSQLTKLFPVLQVFVCVLDTWLFNDLLDGADWSYELRLAFGRVKMKDLHVLLVCVLNSLAVWL